MLVCLLLLSLEKFSRIRGREIIDFGKKCLDALGQMTYSLKCVEFDFIP
jgi:hypothetical protein